MTQRASTSSIDHLCLYSSCLSYVKSGTFLVSAVLFVSQPIICQTFIPTIPTPPSRPCVAVDAYASHRSSYMRVFVPYCLSIYPYRDPRGVRGFSVFVDEDP